MPVFDTTDRIRVLNDELRRSSKQGTILLTRGVAALDAATQADILVQLASFDSFTFDNDPYGEHDFGAFTVGAHKLFFKIDSYDTTWTHASPDPADPSVTRRVLTLMLAEEY